MKCEEIKLSPEDIKKSLRCCSDPNAQCSDCFLCDSEGINCDNYLKECAVKYIEELEARIQVAEAAPKGPVWNKFPDSLPPVAGIEYVVLISGAVAATMLTWDGEDWRDDYGNYYPVVKWMQIPEVTCD